MKLVDSCSQFPGEAIAHGGATNVVDTELDVRDFEGHLYIGHQHAVEIGTAAGLASPQALDAATELALRLQIELDDARAEIRALKAAVEEAESLRHAIAFTLERGAVKDPKKLTVTLRAAPGQKRIDLAKSLFPEPEAAAA